MTHDEAALLLPDYALGAFDGDAEALEAHVRSCDQCTTHLAAFLETTTRLAEAVPMLDPPARLRSSVLSSPAVRRAARQRQWRRLRPLAGFVLPAAALLILAIGLAGWGAVQQRQLAAAQAALAIDGQGLALLTSTETTVVRLEPVGPLGGQAHGHWYHRPGIQTQVLVVEFMPPPPPGQAYFGWLLRADGSAQPAGRFALDSQGYGRLILLGSDGSGIRGVEVTRQPLAAATAPGGQVVLRWPAG